MGRFSYFLLIFAAGASFAGIIPNFYDTFEGTDAGKVFTNSVASGWQASSTSASVSNNSALTYAGTNALVLSDSVMMTNTLDANPNLKIWSDFWIKPVLGVENADPLLTNTASFVCYFDTNGVLYIATAAGWRACTNDVWGSVVPPATNTANKGYVRLSIFQNYSSSTQAVFLNGQLIVQDLGFASTPGSYRQLLFQNTHSNCWLDNVWAQTNFDAATLTTNLNGDTLADAREVNDYGYARRTLYVYPGPTNLVPLYPSITNAVAAWRARDIIHVIAGTYSGENVVLAANPSNVVFEGDAFSVASLTVAPNASASFAQSVSSTFLTVSGQVALASGASLTSAAASVAGWLTVSTNGGFVATDLTVGPAGVISFTTNAQLVAVTAGVTMSGPFAISNNTWNASSLVTLPLTFRDNFDAYAESQIVTNLAFRGWHASGGNVVVQGTVKHTATGRSVLLPSGSVLSNSITPVAAKIWTDFYIQSVWGVEPPVLPTNNSSFVAYVNTSGYLVVATSGGGWQICSNTFSLNNTPAPIKSNGFSRISICQDLINASPVCAVFVDGNLVAQGLSLPVNLSQYTSLAVDSHDGTAYVDDVFISTLVPDGLTNDLDGDGLVDANEINNYGSIALWPKGSIFKVR